MEGSKLIVANVGDSRGVMCNSKGKAIPLSFDHKPQQVLGLALISHTIQIFDNLFRSPFSSLVTSDFEGLFCCFDLIHTSFSCSFKYI